ncbi:class II fructose-1,6-bisphosphate aldolase [Candidatus Woesearchaeota archaeon]|nr:class II fructose-1,6-bisphosphate aldolase [Candidatus Woesearchaeota archaeon]
MAFANTKQLLQKAQRGKYAIGHFNINNLEILQGIVAAAEKLKAPVILSTSEGAIQYAGMDYLVCLAQTAAKKAKIPIALHLDHGRDLRVIKKAINLGYSSVMFDGSHLPFEENVKLTKKVVQWAHRKGVSVEAELGTIGGAEDLVSARKILYTDPQQAAEFVKKTGCDFLAVAIGTSHGAYKFSDTAYLRIDLLKEIKKKVKVPLVLHGASGVSLSLIKEAEKYGAQLSGVSGVPDAQIREAIKLGICKINTDTDLRLAFDAGVRKALAEHPKDFDPRQILAPAREAIQKIAEERIKLFGSEGKG